MRISILYPWRVLAVLAVSGAVLAFPRSAAAQNGSGACVTPDGNCTVTPYLSCVAAGGGYTGDDTQCGQPGACKRSDGTCTSLTAAGCRVVGGTFAGVGTSCPTGACYYKLNQTCSQQTRLDCTNLGRSYSGDNTTCSSNYYPVYVAPTVAPTATPSNVPAGWAALSWQAQDIAVGANGTVWFIDPADNIFRVTPTGNVQAPGGAYRIAVDPVGNAWVVNRDKQIFRWTGSNWVMMNGSALDIGIGRDGKVWILLPDGGVPASWNGSGWTKLSGGGMRITVDSSGNLWMTNAYNQIWRYAAGNFQQMPGAAMDISAGPDGAVYVLGMQTGTGGNLVYHWAGTNWSPDGVYGNVIAAGSGSHAYVGRSGGLPAIMR